MKEQEIDLEKTVKIGCIKPVFSDCINRKLLGEILTIIDASSSNLESGKAIKSLISQAFSRATSKVFVELNNLGGEI